MHRARGVVRGSRGLMRPLLLGAAAAIVVALAGTASLAAAQSAAPISSEADSYFLSDPVREVVSEPPAVGDGEREPVRVVPLRGVPAAAGGAGAAASDPLKDKGAAPGKTPAPDLVFDGLSHSDNEFPGLPPDTVGDVGPSHYIQMTNATNVAIFNKNGTLALPPFDLGSLWPSGDCAVPDDGDPQVLWDSLAGRWVLLQFALDSAPEGLCIAVSQTADPTGSWHLYQFTMPAFPDYPKIGVWPTGYYVGTNSGFPNQYYAHALNRTKMLAGDSTAELVSFGGQPNMMLPADVDGTAGPDAQGGIFYTELDNVEHGGVDRIELYRLTPDFATPANSTFTNFADIPIASFQWTACGFFVTSCVAQQGTSVKIDSASWWPMHRFAYRRFDKHEALVGNFTVGATAAENGASPRWFELRDTGSGWSLYQEGTHDPPDNHNRFMGSIAIAANGDIALGYSVSSSTTFPSIRYAIRKKGNPLGTLKPEETLRAGAGSQTSSSGRWGDYSAMSVDPADECTFWYTNQYYQTTSAADWKTAIGRIPCTN